MSQVPKTGYEVRAGDGPVGTVAEAGFQPGASYVVETGGWILSITVMGARGGDHPDRL